MLRMWAWAYGLRRKATWSIPGRSRSSTNRARPVSRRGSSLRLVREPMGEAVVISLLRIQLEARQRYLDSGCVGYRSLAFSAEASRLAGPVGLCRHGVKFLPTLGGNRGYLERRA